MKLVYAGLGMLSLLVGGNAYATVDFSSYASSSLNNNAVPVALASSSTSPAQAGSPDAQEFHNPSADILSAVSLTLSASNPSDGGSVMVYLVPDSSGAPSMSGSSFSGATLLGTILDSALTTSAAEYSIGGLDVALKSGTYWLGVVGSSTSETSEWWRDAAASTTLVDDATTYALGVNTPGDLNDHLYTDLTLKTTSGSYFEAEIDTTSAPEPASLAIIGSAIGGLGMLRKRRSRKA